MVSVSNNLSYLVIQSLAFMPTLPFLVYFFLFFDLSICKNKELSCVGGVLDEPSRSGFRF